MEVKRFFTNLKAMRDFQTHGTDQETPKSEGNHLAKQLIGIITEQGCSGDSVIVYPETGELCIRVSNPEAGNCARNILSNIPTVTGELPKSTTPTTSLNRK